MSSSNEAPRVPCAACYRGENEVDADGAYACPLCGYVGEQRVDDSADDLLGSPRGAHDSRG